MFIWDQQLIPTIDPLCSLRAYIHHATIAAIHHSLILQAIEKYAKIKRLKFLKNPTGKVSIVLFQWIFDLSFGLPVYLTGNMPKFRTEILCFVSFTKVGLLCYMASITFLLSDITLSVLYCRLVSYVREATSRVHANQQQQMRRDLAMVRRVVLINGQLALVDIPALVFILFSIIRPDLSPNKWMRLLLLNMNAALCPMLIVLFWITPNLRQSLIECVKKITQYLPINDNRVRPITENNRF
ncbi:unnamed protein product [Rotaria sordida]|uniref:G-protein coupled receptors family 1 profile domain-containing protein n=1 Tax=Rotaria sordida TaxID=392033 RepID=A0A814P8W9_9BILA|nr:unnamed protein product [Rotaria sordida]CAF1186501.1 unnamed protein product [Rotaria sordida]CAF1229287.1 unnamed protein product [Rotaria sordida]CAF3761813.1 unnamed protein product [Rotaria sordida]CAF3795545.1 unnamed protein product [Rotaria sordida]